MVRWGRLLIKIGAGIVLLSISVIPILNLIGFTAGGVAAGSRAAAIHSGIGNVTAGSPFAIAQAAGAGGAIPVVVAGIIVGFVLIGSGAAIDRGIRAGIARFASRISGGISRWFRRLF